jgi:hypothetical protein
LFAGWALSALSHRTGDTARARKLLGYTAYGGAAARLLLFTWIANPLPAKAAMSLSNFAAEFSGPISWTNAMDIGGERVGTVSGFMNMLGHFGGSVAPAVTGVLLTLSGNACVAARLPERQYPRRYCKAQETLAPFFRGRSAAGWAAHNDVRPGLQFLHG